MRVYRRVDLAKSSDDRTTIIFDGPSVLRLMDRKLLSLEIWCLDCHVGREEEDVFGGGVICSSEVAYMAIGFPSSLRFECFFAKVSQHFNR